MHLIADNYPTHKTALVRSWFAKRPRFHIHFTPTSASWLNLVERWFGLLTEKQLRRGVHQSSAELEAAIYRYLDVTNEDPKPLVWTKTADQIIRTGSRAWRVWTYGLTQSVGVGWRSLSKREASPSPTWCDA